MTASVDRNNDGDEDYIYTYELIANTISTASAKVVTSNDAVGNLVIKIYDLANFDSVNTIVYSIDSQDGATNYGNATINLSNWTQSGAAYSYTTNFAPEPGTYHYTLQFYNGTLLVGSEDGLFTIN